MRPLLALLLVSVGPSACNGGAMSTSATDGSTTTDTSTSTSSTDGMTSTTAASTSTDGSSSTTEATTETTTGPICPTPETFECDLWSQDECCEGEKCNATLNEGGPAWGTHRCVPVVSDPDQVGEPCRVDNGVPGSDTCELGAMCWNVDPETNVGDCVALCKGPMEQCARDPRTCCEDGFACVVSSGSDLILCLEFCDPIEQNCPGNDELCYPTALGDSFECVPDVPGVKGAEGEPCDAVDACAPGLYCGEPDTYPDCDLESTGCCLPFCRLDDPMCVAGTECQAWFLPNEQAPSIYDDLGACVIPP